MAISGLQSIIHKLYYKSLKALRHPMYWQRFYNSTYKKRYSYTSRLGKFWIVCIIYVVHPHT